MKDTEQSPTGAEEFLTVLEVASERRWNMGLYHRGQTWWMQFTYKGRQARKSTGTSSKKLAEKIYLKVLGEIAERRWFEKLPGEEKTFTEMIAKYLKEHSARNKAPKSHDRDRQLANHLISFFGDLILTEMTPRSIQSTKQRGETKGPLREQLTTSSPS